VLFEKVKISAMKILEKERKARRKKVRRKFRRIVDECPTKSKIQAIKKHQRKKCWNSFLLLKENIGKDLKNKNLNRIIRAEERNKRIGDLRKQTALKIINWVNEKLKKITLDNNLWTNMQLMNSSVVENEKLKKMVGANDEILSNWSIEETRKIETVIKQFENDNTRYIDKGCWNAIRSQNIPILCKGINLAIKSYKEVKIILRRGIKIDYSSTIKMKNLIQCTIVDSIDQGRVGQTYFQLLKNLNMFNRFKNIEDWLLKGNWKEEIIKKVKHKHFTNHKFFKLKRTRNKKPLAVVIPSSSDFEIINKFESSNIDKAINYLK
jgi:hypothetical protein